MLEIIYCDPDYYDILVPEKMPCTQPMWDKVMEGAPTPYMPCLISAYTPSVDEVEVGRMCQWIQRIMEAMRAPSKLWHCPLYSGEGLERNNERSVYEEDPRGKDSKGRKEGSYSRSRSWSPHAAHEKTGRPKSKTQNKCGLLGGLLRKLGENMNKWDGEPTSKLEARLQELKQKLAGKKAVHIVEAKTQEKKHRLPRCKRNNSVNSDGEASDRASLKSNGEYSDEEQQQRGSTFCREKERDQDDNWVYWAVWVRWPGTLDPRRYQALVDTGAKCTLMPSEHESAETVSISGVTGGSRDLSVV
ncbi:hypothetical protein WISP_94758 [Willisornis vidua]|uniref:Peptidase A2 domain-containing protein n=1 Tax=Willisornis vidua TaxID=1566151 RepID=A0ABQ9D0E8_9PASS|nr:hypothetical protein WISP_94758 [Willisornis vidua]